MTVARRVAIASAFAVLQRLLMRGIGLIGTLILVRLLSPEDFGIVGTAAVVQTILEYLTATGFGLALIRMRDPQPVHYHTAFTLTLGRGIAIGALLLATADLQAEFMGEPRVAPVMQLLALTAVLQSLENIRLFDLQRDLRFDVLLRYHVLNRLLNVAIAVPLALWLRSYWALVLSVPLARLVLTPVSYWMVPYRPRLSLGAWRELFQFSKWLFLGNLCNVVDGQAITVAAGRFIGMAAVGFYQVAFQVAALPITELAAPIRQPAYAGFARVREDPATLGRYVIQGLALQWVVILPLSAGVALTSREITLLVLGSRWIPLIPLIPLVAGGALFDAIRDYLANVFIVLGRQRRFVLTFAALSALRVSLVVWGAGAHGLIGAAGGMLGTAVLGAALWLVLAMPLLALGPGGAVGTLWRPCLAALAMAGAVLAVPDGGETGPWQVAGTLAVKAGLGAAVYGAVLLALWFACGRPAESAEGNLLGLCSESLRRILPARGRRT